DGDGFQEYQTRSPIGYENMSWKDAGDTVMNPDGSPVKGPKALCELQGYVYSPGCVWRRSTMSSATPGGRGSYVQRRLPFSTGSMKPSGTKNSDSMLMRLTATRRRC